MISTEPVRRAKLGSLIGLLAAGVFLPDSCNPWVEEPTGQEGLWLAAEKTVKCDGNGSSVGICLDGRPNGPPVLMVSREDQIASIRQSILMAQPGVKDDQLEFWVVGDFEALGWGEAVEAVQGAPTTRPGARLGSSISFKDAGGGGTLGCRVRKTKSKDEVFLLSNWHVLTPPDRNCENKQVNPVHICHPATSKTPRERCNLVATLACCVEVSGNRTDHVMDAAIATTTRDQVGARGPCPKQLTPSSSVVEAEPKMKVAMQGAESEFMEGSVACANATVCVNQVALRRFVRQIAIEPKLEGVFCKRGDSGSLLVEHEKEAYNPTGLIFAHSIPVKLPADELPAGTGPKVKRLCLANPIKDVFHHFGIEIDPPTNDESASNCEFKQE